MGWIALVIVVVVLCALVWWNARTPDGPGGEATRRSRERGGGTP